MWKVGSLTAVFALLAALRAMCKAEPIVEKLLQLIKPSRVDDHSGSSPGAVENPTILVAPTPTREGVSFSSSASSTDVLGLQKAGVLEVLPIVNDVKPRRRRYSRRQQLRRNSASSKPGAKE